MSSGLHIENILVQVRSRLQDGGVKLWIEPYYVEGIGPVDNELEVSVFLILTKISDVMVECEICLLSVGHFYLNFIIFILNEFLFAAGAGSQYVPGSEYSI